MLVPRDTRRARWINIQIRFARERQERDGHQTRSSSLRTRFRGRCGVLTPGRRAWASVFPGATSDFALLICGWGNRRAELHLS